MRWQQPALALADRVVGTPSRWHAPIAATPRHLLVPRWWQRTPAWRLVDGAADPDAWLDAAYSNQTLVTQVGALHADQADTAAAPTGRSTSSSTLPGLLVSMYRHARITDGMDVLDIGTGSGYGTALLCHRLGPQHVTSVDIDAYLVKAAAERLGMLGLEPHFAVADATGALPGEHDRIVATTAVSPVPCSWLSALRPGGRLVTTLAGTTAILTADKQPDGTATGRIERDWAGFMEARTGPNYPPDLDEQHPDILERDGEQVGPGLYPIVIPEHAWELRSMLAIEHPGIEDHHRADPDGSVTVWLLHADGSWARAYAQRRGELPVVHQGGPRRLWDLLDALRTRWLADGCLPLYGALARIETDGTIRLARGAWRATIS